MRWLFYCDRDNIELKWNIYKIKWWLSSYHLSSHIVCPSIFILNKRICSFLFSIHHLTRLAIKHQFIQNANKIQLVLCCNKCQLSNKLSAMPLWLFIICFPGNQWFWLRISHEVNNENGYVHRCHWLQAFFDKRKYCLYVVSLSNINFTYFRISILKRKFWEKEGGSEKCP